MTVNAAKAAGLVVVAVLLQLTIFAPVDIAGGGPDLVLLVVAIVALLAGSVVGALSGFWAGFLYDSASLGTLGVSSLLLTLVGYWVGRYGETSAQDRAHAPLLAVGSVTVLTALGTLVLHYTLGEPTSARWLLFDRLPAELVLNVLLALPVWALGRRLFTPRGVTGYAQEVELVG